MLYLNIFLITVAMVIVIDLTDLPDTITSIIHKYLTGKKEPFELKPITCSFCMSFWVNLFYIFITNNFTIVNLTYILLLSFFTPVVKDFLIIIRDKIIKLLNYLND